MGKSTKTYEERIQEKDLRIEKLAQELKRYEAQKKQLEKRRKEEERKIRTHRLIEIGAAVEYHHTRAFDPLGLGTETSLDSIGFHKIRRFRFKFK